MCILKLRNDVETAQLGKRLNLEIQNETAPKFAKYSHTEQEYNEDALASNTEREYEPQHSAPIQLHGFLIAAAQRGNLQKMKELIDDPRYEIDINETQMGSTALHFACFYKHLEIVQYLIEIGCAIDAKNEAGRTPLSWAVEQRAYDVVGFLLESEADPSIAENTYNLSPLHIAVKMNDYNMVETLLSINTETEEWTKLNAVDKAGFTAVSYAALIGNLDIVAILFEYGADLNIVSVENKISPLYRAVARGHFKVVEYLLQNGANVNSMDSLGRTVLHTAVLSGKIDMVKLLASHGAIEFQDKSGNTPSSLTKQENIVSFLSIQ